jgi:hypothetical protein
MTGAWTFNNDTADRVPKLVGGRRVLVTDVGLKVLQEYGANVTDRIDPAATVDNLEIACRELQASYEAQPKRDSLVEPRWPILPRRFDALAAETATSEDFPLVTLRMARWLEQVATSWDQIERVRIVRRYMPGGPTRRTTPIIVQNIEQ